MLDISGISDLKFAGNVLASEHGSEQCRVIETDPGSGLESFVHIGKITGFHSLCLMIIIGDVGGDISVEGFQHINILTFLGDKRPGQLTCLAFFRKVHILIGIQEGKKLIF